MNSLRYPATRAPSNVQLRFASNSRPAFGRTAAYRRLLSQSHALSISSTSIPSVRLRLSPLRSRFLPDDVRIDFTGVAAARRLHSGSKLAQDQKGTTKETTPEEPATGKAAEETSRKAEADQETASEKEKSRDGKDEKDEGEGHKEEKKENAPPPPPHGNKSPWQVFTETLQSEFKASKEWNESTKALASSAHQFTESESVKRARQAYEASSSAVSSTTANVLKTTAGAVGKGAAWTWETPVVKGVRSTVNATANVIEKGTRPIRETEAYKNVKNVIDDGSSSRYGGWVEKEERRKVRERRELEEAAATGRHGKKMEVPKEDPK
jgi:mitochondrial import inner membrane translocase subunit TIM44